MSQALFVLTPEARQDLLEIWDYIAEDNLDTADRVLAHLYESFTRLARAPGMGHCRKTWLIRDTVSGLSIPM